MRGLATWLRYSAVAVSFAIVPLLTGAGCLTNIDSTQSVMALIEADESLTTFAAALQSAGLDGILRNSNVNTYTVFAPTNDAFDGMAAQIRENLFAEGNEAWLLQVLKGHITAGDYSTSDLSPGDVLTDLNGEPIVMTRTNGVLQVGGASFVDPNSEAGNGMLHTIGKVIMPQ